MHVQKYDIITFMKKNLLTIFGIVIFVIIIQWLISLTDIFNQLELITYDIRSKIATDKGPFNRQFTPIDNNIMVVTIDDYSRKELAKNPQVKLGSWPWPRYIWADIVNFIEQGKPKAILFDIVFNELNENQENDKKFSQELRKHKNVVLATSLNDPKFMVDRAKKGAIVENSFYQPTAHPLNVKIYDKNIENQMTFYSHAPVPDIYTKYNSTGVVNKIVDPDSVIRNVRPVFKLVKNGKTYFLPSLAFAGFLKYMGEDGEIVIKNNKLFYKGRIIPINDNSETAISWHGKGHDYKFISISQIILHDKHKKDISSKDFKDKIVVIGRTEAGSDIHPSAVNPSYPGPEANASAIDNFINDSFPDKKGTRKFLTKMDSRTSFLSTLLCCLCIALISLISKNALISFANSIGFILLYVLYSIFMFANPNIRIFVPMIVPLYYLIMTAAIMFSYRFQKELAKRATVMNAFGKFVSPKVLSTILKNQENLALKSTKKRITVMFCDIKGFTTLSEKCNPEELVENMNELFNKMVDIIFENNGTVDKFIGDCIMAYWGDPIASDDDAYMAVKTAIEIKQAVNELKIKNEKENKIVLDVKMGINTGEALLGLSGSEKIMSYTAMGDAVNVASRLESNCSKLGKDILISKTTYEDSKDKIIFTQAGKISVKGREEEVEVYEPARIKGEAVNDKTQA